ncbi:MAG: hypothetical protein ABJF10_26935 [Chthoniobacter sp.]|uniref:hypothetical protein n=1 Tax=Chthoniobacter sp. TaxID=2510640 RepID=UPI0032ADFA7C
MKKLLMMTAMSCVFAMPTMTAFASQMPSFLQVGHWYVALYTGEPRRPLHFKVLERAGGAWIKIEHRDGVMWLNTDAALLIKPGNKE